MQRRPHGLKFSVQETDLRERSSHVHVEDVLLVQEVEAASYVQQHLMAPADTAHTYTA